MSNKSFKTSQFYLAAFLHVKGMELIGIDRTDPRRCQFIFADIPQREMLIEAFNFAGEDAKTVMVDARKLVNVLKNLKDKLHQGIL